jgi:hypothetical protein
MRFPFGKKGFLAASALSAGVIYWRVKTSRAEEERRWREELDAATAEGIAAAEAAKKGQHSVETKAGAE